MTETGPARRARIAAEREAAIAAVVESLRAIADSSPKRSVPDNQFDAGWLAAHEKFCSYARASLAAYDQAKRQERSNG